MVRIVKKFAIVLALLIGLLVVALFCVFFWYRSASQPQIDGKLQLTGVAAPIDIVRDAEGIPHIYAKSADDAYFALGFVHAQDRLWQLELNRRIPAGRIFWGPGLSIPTAFCARSACAAMRRRF